MGEDMAPKAREKSTGNYFTERQACGSNFRYRGLPGNAGAAGRHGRPENAGGDAK